MRVLIKYITYLFTAAVMLCVSCSSYEESWDYTEDLQSDDDTTLSKGYESFEFELPRLPRFESFIEEYGEMVINVEVYMMGRTITDEYVATATMVADSESLYVSATDATFLAELHHQDYFVNYMIITGATRSSEEDTYPEGAMVIGALLSASDPDDIYFISTFSSTSTVSGSGTEFDPYIIANMDCMKSCIADELDAGNDLDGVWFLQSDHLNFLNYSSSSSDPVYRIGKESNTYFNGHYDGGMMTISQLTIDAEETSCVALFYGFGANAFFCNAIFENISIRGDYYSSIIAAECMGGIISHVFVESSCSVNGDRYTGGYVGRGYGSVYDSTFRGSVSGNSRSGGFYGNSFTDSNGSFEFIDCVFSGTVTSTSSYTGGLIGSAENIDDINIDNVAISGTIYSEESHTGGLIGQLDKFSSCSINEAYLGQSRTTDTDTYTNGSLYESALSLDNYSGSSSGSLASSVGGLIGHIYGGDGASMKISASSFVGSNSGIYGDSYVGGAIGYVYGVNFNDSDFTNEMSIYSSSEISGRSYVGGVIGYIGDSTFTNVSFINRGDVEASGEHVGGVIGQYDIELISSSAQGLELVNYGNISGGEESVGGCVGMLNSADYVTAEGQAVADTVDPYISYSNYGFVSGVNYVGGFVGYIAGDPYMRAESGVHKSGSSDSSYSVTVSGVEYVGGLFGYIDFQMDEDGATREIDIYGTTVSSVNGSGDFTGGIIGGCGTPIISSIVDYYYTDCSATLTLCEYGSTVTIKGTNIVGGVIGGQSLAVGTTFTIQDACSVLSSTSSVEGTSFVGGVMGGASNNAHVYFNNCSNIAEVELSGTGYGAGGIFGGYDFDSSVDLGNLITNQLMTVDFSDCYNTGSITSGGNGVGGIIGFARAYASFITASQSCNVGYIKYTDSGEAHIGGLFGYIAGEGDNDGGSISISECYNAGTVYGGDHRGGLVGRSVPYLEIEHCFNMGYVPSGGTYIAGIVGSIKSDGNDGHAYIHDTYNIGSTGYGILGGEEKVDHDDCSMSDVYYLSSASSGDIDLGKDKYNSTGLSASSMADGDMDLNSSYFTTPSNMSTTGELPYLKSVKYYENYPKVSL